ncbi:hypothetical protein ACTNE3_11585 [Bacillota bacterium HCP3S3_F1_1]
MITEIPKQAGWIVRLFRVSSVSLVLVESLHRSFSTVVRHPLFDVLVDVVFYIVADVGPYVVVYVGADFGPYVVVYVRADVGPYVALCVGADFGPYVVLCVGADVGVYAVLYVVLLIFSTGGQTIRSSKPSGASEHVGFLPR